MSDLFLDQLVGARQAEFRAEAAKSRLAALASCCGWPAWRRGADHVASAAHGVREWFRRGQLGPGPDACTNC